MPCLGASVTCCEKQDALRCVFWPDLARAAYRTVSALQVSKYLSVLWVEIQAAPAYDYNLIPRALKRAQDSVYRLFSLLRTFYPHKDEGRVVVYCTVDHAEGENGQPKVIQWSPWLRFWHVRI